MMSIDCLMEIPDVGQTDHMYYIIGITISYLCNWIVVNRSMQLNITWQNIQSGFREYVRKFKLKNNLNTLLSVDVPSNIA